MGQALLIFGFSKIWYRAPRIHAYNTFGITAPQKFKVLNASNGAHVIDLVEIVFAGDTPQSTRNCNASVKIILKNRPKTRCKLACKVVNKRSIFDFNSPF